MASEFELTRTVFWGNSSHVTLNKLFTSLDLSFLTDRTGILIMFLSYGCRED